MNDTAGILAAHSDPALDEHFPPIGPCGVCGTPGLDQRHRVVDAIAGHLMAGENPKAIADEFNIPWAAVRTVGEWMTRWPGAWE